MTTADLIKKIRKIEIKTKGLTNQMFAGEYHSAFKGRGMSFSEVREYSHGDDVRNIDWNVTAKYQIPFVKVYEEERELTVMILVDISNSELFGTRQQIKRDLITEISAVLSFAAVQNNDKVGLVLFSDQVEKYIPPKKGKSHVLRIIRELLFTQARNEATSTDINSCLKYFNNINKKRTIAFLLSDFISQPFEEALKLSARKHDLVGIKIYDIADQILPKAGLIQVQDSETRQTKWINTNNKATREVYEKNFIALRNYCETVFKKNGAQLLSIRTDESYIKLLQQFFANRN